VLVVGLDFALDAWVSGAKNVSGAQTLGQTVKKMDSSKVKVILL